VDPGNLSACRTRNVNATSPPPACAAPSISITAPTADQCFNTTNIPVSATATGANSVLFRSDEIDCKTLATTDPDEASTVVSGSGPIYATVFKVGIGPVVCYRIKARALTSCPSVFTDATPVARIFVQSVCFAPLLETAPTAWSSDLTVENGQLQVTVNGAVTYADRGRGYGTSPLGDGENRVEATLVSGAGKPGLWRFDVVKGASLDPGTVQVLTGDVVSVTSNTVTFRLQGIPGERVAFTFVRK
jgi:hypothetical protein